MKPLGAAVTFERDPNHWLFKLSADEWVRAALGELRRAEAAYARRDPRAGLAGARRAAGMALNGALVCVPDDAFGRSYMDHLAALARDASAPEKVRAAAKVLVDTPLSGGGALVALRTTSSDDRVLEAARDVVAHAYAIVKRSEGGPS